MIKQPSIAKHCSHCKSYETIPYSEIISQSNSKGNPEIHCPKCQARWGEIINCEDVFDYCPVCQCRQFYLMKNFNQFLGCSIMLIAIVLVPKTYGLSLPVFAGIDWLLHRKSKYITVCYKCATEFKDFEVAEERFKPFMHHIGLKYDKFR